MSESAENVEDMWKENLKEWVYEESKIVTYKWLSKQLSVHVNIAKQMLFDFTQSHLKDEKKTELEVIYLLAGRLSSSPKSIKVSLVKSSDLAAKEAELVSLTSKHVYAVSKSETKVLTESNICQVFKHTIYIPADVGYLCDFQFEYKL